jgi:hypothetical protein
MGTIRGKNTAAAEFNGSVKGHFEKAVEAVRPFKHDAETIMNDSLVPVRADTNKSVLDKTARFDKLRCAAE